MTDSSPPFESEYMQLAVSLARKSRPSPNPRVGAVLVKDGEIVGQGYHIRPGTPHAEVHALREAGERADGADLYVTLEPCVHTGRTGPCVKAIEEAGIKRVFVGMTDPDSRVNGQGIAYLERLGIEIHSGVDEVHCNRLLEGYTTHRTKGRPHVTIKAATTLDGYIATTTHDSKWISSAESRREAHRLRAEADAILVGIETVIHDDPMLTVRNAEGPNPTRVVLDSKLRIDPGSKLVRSARETPLILACADSASPENRQRLSNIPGVSLLSCDTDHQGRIALPSLLIQLGERGVLSVLVEGGSKVISTFLEAALVDQLILFIAPKILGAGIPFTVHPGAETVSNAVHLSVDEVTQIDGDIYYRARPKNQESKLKS